MTAATTTRDPAQPAALPRQPWNRHLAVVAVLAVLLVPLPLVLPGAQEAVVVRVLIFALLSIGWNIMSGFGGMFSFGQAAYFGLGAYTRRGCSSSTTSRRGSGWPSAWSWRRCSP